MKHIIPVNELPKNAIVNKDDVLNTPSVILDFFLENKREILYVLENKSICGIITLGDYKQHFLKPSEIINKKFRYLVEDTIQEADEIFQLYPFIHEIPILSCDLSTNYDSELIGILSEGYCYSEEEWSRREKHIQYIKSFYYDYVQLKNFCETCPAKVFLYNIPIFEEVIKYLDEKDKKIGNARRAYDVAPYINSFIKDSQGEKSFFGEGSCPEFYHKMLQEIFSVKMDIINGIPKIADYSGVFFDFYNGYRFEEKTINSTNSRTIWLFGPCIVRGGYVSNTETISAYLRKLFEENSSWVNWNVKNCGISGEENLLGRVVAETISENDVVVIVKNFPEAIKNDSVLASYYKGSWSIAYGGVKNPLDCYLNTPVHCNGTINKNIANIIWNDLLEEKVFENHHYNPNPKSLPAKDYYIGYNIIESVETTMKSYKVDVDGNARVGAIVMNCNPFTKGHRYLVEHALKQVDLLYVFVVEEDKSVFKFQDRFRMVQEGLKDLENIVVLPSGKYIISKETFSQYFTKDQVREVQSMDYDVRIFGEVVAPFLNITCRFVGQEPFDRVTNTYNETMKRILPEYGIDLVEIERVSNENGQIISATMVRKLLEENRWDELRNFLPESTIGILRK